MDLDTLFASLDPPEIVRLAFWLLVVFVITVIALRVTQRLVDGVVDRALTRPQGDDTRGQLSVVNSRSAAIPSRPWAGTWRAW